MRITVTILTLVAALSLSACTTETDDENEAMCKEVKPGVVTSVNAYCAVVSDDPVNPEVFTEYKGQRVGFCCKGCVPKWEALSDAQKDAALARAIVKGKPKS